MMHNLSEEKTPLNNAKVKSLLKFLFTKQFNMENHQHITME